LITNPSQAKLSGFPIINRKKKFNKLLKFKFLKMMIARAVIQTTKYLKIIKVITAALKNLKKCMREKMEVGSLTVDQIKRTNRKNKK